MKIGLYIALLCLAMVPAYAQNAASQDRHAIGEATTTLVPDYADRLNGLLRDIHATLQTISTHGSWGVDAATGAEAEACSNAIHDRALGDAFSSVRRQDSIGRKCTRQMHTGVRSFE